MNPRFTRTAALAVAFVPLLNGCAFNDTLTARGFVKEGDQICVETLVRTGVGFSAGDTSQSQFLASLGTAYGEAAAGFRRLDIRSDDEAMRDKAVAAFTSYSRRFESAAAGATPPSEVRSLFDQIAALQEQMKAYGFDVCGGGGARPG